ncbi:MAG: L,D-transpeptidase [Gemmatimonadota bacterium]
MSFLRTGGRTALAILGTVVVLTLTTVAVGYATVTARYKRDLTRMVFNDNLELLESVKREVGAESDSLRSMIEAPVDTTANRPYIVVSIADHRLTYRHGDDVLFTTRVATGSGKVLAKGGGNQWKFETPRGRLVVLSKEQDPVWVPPDWHYVEVAHKKKLGLLKLQRGTDHALNDGSMLTVQGSNVVRRLTDGTLDILEPGEGRELIVDGQVVVPPFGTNQRKFPGVLGTHRLNLGDGYALHGTNAPSSIGTSVSHGCVRLRDEDAETLFRIVPVGTPVFIY